MIQYFAYGSNMLTERLRDRCASANVRGVASVADWTLSFSKKSRHGCGMATIEQAPESRLFGVVFELDERELRKLDAAEGVSYGYNRDDAFLVQMQDSGEALKTSTYIADSMHCDSNLRPFDWYRALVVAGARQHGLPSDYINRIGAIQSIADPLPGRPQRLKALDLLKETDLC